MKDTVSHFKIAHFVVLVGFGINYNYSRRDVTPYSSQFLPGEPPQTSPAPGWTSHFLWCAPPGKHHFPPAPRLVALGEGHSYSHCWSRQLQGSPHGVRPGRDGWQRSTPERAGGRSAEAEVANTLVILHEKRTRSFPRLWDIQIQGTSKGPSGWMSWLDCMR